MAGLINSVKDPVLVRIMQGVEAKIPKTHRRDFQAIVTAGLKVLASDQTHHLLVDGLKQGQAKGNVPRAIVTGVVQLVSLIYKESRGRMSVPMAAPAGVVLMCYILQYAESAIHTTVTNEMAAQMTHAVTVGVLGVFKIDQNKLAQGVEYARDHRDQFKDLAPQEGA